MSNEVIREISLNSSSKSSGDESFVSADEESQSCLDVNETEKQCDIFQTLRESFLRACKGMDRELKVHTSIDFYCSGTATVTLVKAMILSLDMLEFQEQYLEQEMGTIVLW